MTPHFDALTIPQMPATLDSTPSKGTTTRAAKAAAVAAEVPASDAAAETLAARIEEVTALASSAGTVGEKAVLAKVVETMKLKEFVEDDRHFSLVR